MRRRIFDPEGWLWKPLGYLGDFVMLSLLWAVCCLPVLTAGASTAALYDTAVHVFRRKDDTLFSRFFATFRRELGSGALSTGLWAAVILTEYFLYTALRSVLPVDGNSRAVLFAALVLLAFFTLCVLSWVFPILSRFTMRTAALNLTAARLAFGHILRSAALALLIAATGALSLLLVFPLMALPGISALLASYLIEPVFHPFEFPASDGTD